MHGKTLNKVAWAIAACTIVGFFAAWASYNSWNLDVSNIFQLFPLLGLTAYGLMWGHYVVSVLRMHYGLDRAYTAVYFRWTSRLVLVCILLHPGLLEWQLWREGAGLPPGSLLSYAPQGLGLFIILGISSLLAFLAYELKPWLEKSRVWSSIENLSNLAMLLIFAHALKLGNTLVSGWFRVVWVLMGAVLVGCLCYIYYNKYSEQ